LAYQKSKMGGAEADAVMAAQDRMQHTMHWSQLEPLANNKVSNPRPDMFVNPADGIIDEEAERAAFAEAVLEWRGGGGALGAGLSSGGQRAKPDRPLP
jgi:hypothetical protein